MCGICGIARAEGGAPVGRRTVEAMMDELRHRGPDDAGVHLDGNVGLGHRRLSIVDLEGGRQPIPNEDESVWVAVNGEIYNHPELSERLKSRGHRYRTRSDSETIVHLYEEHGTECLRRLRGMFAFSLWDARSRRLLLARDRLGIKPLYYAFSAEGDLVWGSEVKALFASGLVRPRMERSALPEYLANRYTSGRRTLYRGVHRLQPGHYLQWHDGRWEEKAYWRLEDVLAAGQEEPERSFEDVVDAFSHRFEDAVRSHLMSDVPVGVFLSGGLDSSAVATVMHEIVGSRLTTFSVGYPDSEASELGFARELADHLGSRHREVVVTADDFFEALPKLVWHEDKPIAFPSSVPLYFVAELASEWVKVVLTGEGSDELLAGYGKYWRTLWNVALGRRWEQLPGPVRSCVRQAVAALPHSSRTVQRLERTFLTRPVDVESLYFDNFGVFTGGDLEDLLAPDLRASVAGNGGDPYGPQRRLWHECPPASLLNRLLHLDTRSYLHELLMKQDRMSMAASLESRVPFLDAPLVEFAFGLPDEAKLRRFEGKRVLRAMMRERLPGEILNRPKMGFPTPVGQWLATSYWDWVERYVLDPGRVTAPFFDVGAVERLAHEHREGVRDHTERLWSLLNLELWARQHPAMVEG